MVLLICGNGFVSVGMLRWCCYFHTLWTDSRIVCSFVLSRSPYSRMQTGCSTNKWYHFTRGPIIWWRHFIREQTTRRIKFVIANEPIWQCVVISLFCCVHQKNETSQMLFSQTKSNVNALKTRWGGFGGQIGWHTCTELSQLQLNWVAPFHRHNSFYIEV